MYERITDENGYKQPMRIYPAPHYAMGGLWVDYNLMSNLPGLFVLGEANFSVHGANRLGASALMQGLADGYFVIPNTIGGYLAGAKPGKVKADHPECAKSIAEVKASADKFLAVNGKRTVTDFIRELGTLMWNNVGMARSEQSLTEAHQEDPRHPRGVPPEREGDRARARSSTSSSRTPAARPTSSSSPSCSPATRCTATSRAAATSASSTSTRTARRSATTRTSPTRRRGSSRASARSPSFTRSR